MNVGEKLKISCPAYLSNGGAEFYSHMGSKKVPANTPITYEIEVLECQMDLENISRPTDKRFHKKHDKFLHTHLKRFEGDNTHDENGEIRRNGGGPAKDYVAEVGSLANNVKIKDVDKLKKIV